MAPTGKNKVDDNKYMIIFDEISKLIIEKRLKNRFLYLDTLIIKKSYEKNPQILVKTNSASSDFVSDFKIALISANLFSFNFFPSLTEPKLNFSVYFLENDYCLMI